MNLAALDERVREAVERFERETGRRIEDEFPAGPVDQKMIELFLILNKYELGSEAASRATHAEQSGAPVFRDSPRPKTR